VKHIGRRAAEHGGGLRARHSAAASCVQCRPAADADWQHTAASGTALRMPAMTVLGTAADVLHLSASTQDTAGSSDDALGRHAWGLPVAGASGLACAPAAARTASASRLMTASSATPPAAASAQPSTTSIFNPAAFPFRLRRSPGDKQRSAASSAEVACGGRAQSFTARSRSTSATTTAPAAGGDEGGGGAGPARVRSQLSLGRPASRETSILARDRVAATSFSRPSVVRAGSALSLLHPGGLHSPTPPGASAQEGPATPPAAVLQPAAS
jgi:hypothetical protein